MKTTLLILATFLILSCEKEKQEPEENPITWYLQNFDFNIEKYSIGNDTIDIKPDILLDFSGGYIIDNSHHFTWTIDKNKIYITGDFFENLPSHEIPMDNYIEFLYHESNLNLAVKHDTILHTCGSIEYTYYLKSE